MVSDCRWLIYSIYIYIIYTHKNERKNLNKNPTNYKKEGYRDGIKGRRQDNDGNNCNTLLTLGAHAQRGLLYLLCVSVCMCVCVCLPPLILALQTPNRLMSDTNGSSTTSARKLMWRFR